jgi:hypothetical protein
MRTGLCGRKLRGVNGWLTGGIGSGEGTWTRRGTICGIFGGGCGRTPGSIWFHDGTSILIIIASGHDTLQWPTTFLVLTAFGKSHLATGILHKIQPKSTTTRLARVLGFVAGTNEATCLVIQGAAAEKARNK